MRVKVIIPAFNEEESIAHVINDIPKEYVEEVIVCNNSSTDRTEEVARNAGATVVLAEQAGYGNACLRGLEYIATQELTAPDVVVFLDGDYSDYPHQMVGLLDKIKQGYDLVIGSRSLGKRESGSMTFPQVFGNWLATILMSLLYGARYTDLGPFRAIKYEVLKAIQMEDKTYGWTIEMQMKVLRRGYSYTEIPVDYKNRIGVSKISGTVKGVIGAGFKIITSIFKYRK